VAEALTARHEQPEEEPAIETGEVMEEYPQEEEYEEPAEEEYQESGEYENVPPPLPRIVINIPDKIPKNLAKKLESRGIKIPKNKIK
jgi:hypothetical protein